MKYITVEKESLLRLLNAFSLIIDKMIKGEEVNLPSDQLLHLSKAVTKSIAIIESE